MPRILSEEKLGRDRIQGFYETPWKTVEYMCGKVLAAYRPGRRVLDPAVGDGVFLHALLAAGVRREDLFGFDIDAEKVADLRPHFPGVQIFDATEPFPGSFDIIVGNPPYNGDESHFIRSNRDRLKKNFKGIGARNTYSMITFRAVEALKEGGVLCLILADSFLTNTYYAPFRRFLDDALAVEEILLAPWRLFHGRSADVRTCIVTARRGRPHPAARVRLVDRIKDEAEYTRPAAVEYIAQAEFARYPDHAILIGIPDSIRQCYLGAARRLGEVAQGGCGISTGQDRHFLRPRAEVAGLSEWVPYYKNGARAAYWYEPAFHIERNYQRHRQQYRNYLVRNERFFFREGISCSSVGVRFTAAYMPAGCLFGVNTNFFFDDRQLLFYTLGLLNSKVAWYFARKILSRSNNISANYLRRLPFPDPGGQLPAVAALAQQIVTGLQANPGFDPTPLQREIDQRIFALFALDRAAVAHIEDFCAHFYERL